MSKKGKCVNQVRTEALISPERFEGLGTFYLGREFDVERGTAKPEPILYESKDLTIHAVCVGMTGSGKTGLCLSLLEEAGIDGIPAIAIDPKGDLGNLLLTFPELRPQDFAPWIDEQAASAAGRTPEELAAETAAAWRQGLSQWGQDGARIRRFREAVDLSIYTPGSRAGSTISLLDSLAPPAAEVAADSEALAEHVGATASGLLGLLGIAEDPLRSREHILLSQLLAEAWRNQRTLDLPALVREIQSPRLARVGVVDLETFYPARERFALAMQFNNLLASPSLAAWAEGEPLDIQRLLYTPAGRPRISVLSIAHLGDRERMFFVTMLLSAMVSWMRSQTGTSSLRAILYMDEVFGFLPPTANPPSKLPMLTLLKQARAAGLGVVLATQNPVDLDYKALSNAGTWWIGRLQTERDKARVIDGLEGASSAAGAVFDRGQTEAQISGLRKRVFLMKNVHEDLPVTFETRWTLSYLKGPLTRQQIERLMADRKLPQQPAVATSAKTPAEPTQGTAGDVDRPLIPPGIEEAFIPPKTVLASEQLFYVPGLLASARLHFVNARAGIDRWEELQLWAPLEGGEEIWQRAQPIAFDSEQTEPGPRPNARFGSLPAEATQVKSYAGWTSGLKGYLMRERSMVLWKHAPSRETSKPGESEGDFRARLADRDRQKCEAQRVKLKDRYGVKYTALRDQLRKAEARVDREKSQASRSTLDAVVSAGTSLLGALLGRKRIGSTNVGRTATAVRAAGRATAQRGDIERAEEERQAVRQKLEELEASFVREANEIPRADPTSFELVQVPIRPKKSDISVSSVCLAWMPQGQLADSSLRPSNAVGTGA